VALLAGFGPAFGWAFCLERFFDRVLPVPLRFQNRLVWGRASVWTSASFSLSRRCCYVSHPDARIRRACGFSDVSQRLAQASEHHSDPTAQSFLTSSERGCFSRQPTRTVQLIACSGLHGELKRRAERTGQRGGPHRQPVCRLFWGLATVGDESCSVVRLVKRPA
jgi:hypothetical protein